MSFEFKVAEFIKKIKPQNMTIKEIGAKLGFYSKFELTELRKVVFQMVDEGVLEIVGKEKFTIKKQTVKFSGVLRGNKRGFAFLIRDDGGEDIFIPHQRLNGAMHGDTVLAEIIKGDEGRVVKVLSRGITRLVGVYQKSKNFGFVVPDDMSYYSDIFIPNKKDAKAENNTKVVVEITKFGGKTPEGVIVEVIGKAGEKQSDVLSILKSYGFYNTFPKECIAEIEHATYKPTANRVNFCDMLTITIDGDDSKDLDDAISLFKIGDKYKLYVHIADVSHYVELGSVVDKEAFKRCTSVYFPNNVYPMLPKELSNGICSLNEKEDRLALSAIMLINKSGVVEQFEVVKSIINNDYRMTYNNVTAILEGDNVLKEEYSEIVDMLEQAWELAKKLKKKRDGRGNINFDTKESKIILDEQGNVEKIEEYPYTISNEIIEEFMIVANESVAEYVCKKELPFVYRIHEKPDEEKMSEFRKFLEICGTRLAKDNVTPLKLQEVLESVAGTPFETIVNKVMLRNMKKAKYSAENTGHFGLASEFYCHFTSPIRRYPDLQIHRIIKDMIDGSLKSLPKLANWCVEVAEVSSERERASESAERDIDDYYKTEYMLRHIGDEFEGIISGVTSFGVFVELENTCEGLAKLDNLPKDDYTFIENRYMIKGTKHSYSLGQKTKVKVLSCDKDSRRVAFEILEE